MLSLLLLLQAGQATAPPATGPVVPGAVGTEVTIPRLVAEVKVDGRLDEAVWDHAIRLTGFHQYQPVDGRPAELTTEVLVWYAPDAIYFGVRAHADPATVRATVADRDRLGSDDRVTIYLDTFDDQRRAFFFGVNPLGHQEDGVRTEGTGNAGQIFGGNIDRNPDYLWQSSGRLTDYGYEVEIRIPFKSLRFPNAPQQTWGLNVTRFTQQTGYEDTWTDVRRANASFLAQSGLITGLHDLHRGLVTELQPFVTATANGARDAATDKFQRDNVNPDVGVNLRLGLTAVSLDATVNPDFSQVESDVGQVTVNERFALFFPEKRPFFLEGIELFSTPNQLVYTRRIANPLVGAKVSGKLGGTTFAYLSAVDELDGGNALFNIGRVRQDFGSGSTIGLTLTTFDQKSDFNRVAAADSRILFGKLYFVEGQLGASWTGQGGPSTVAPIGQLTLDRTGRSWGFNYQIAAIGTDFKARAGFVNRTGIVTGHIFNRLSFYGKRGALVENFTTFFGPRRIWDYDSFGAESAIEGGEDLNLNFQLRGGWSAGSQISRNFVSFDSTDYRGYTVDRGGTAVPYLPPPRLTNMYSASLSLGTPTFQNFDAGITVNYGEVAIFDEGSAGRELRVTGNIGFRPTRSVRTELSLVWSQIWRQRTAGEFARTVIPRVKLAYQPNSALFFRVIGEYRSQRQTTLESADGSPISIGGSPTRPSASNGFEIDVLASYEPTPGTVAFLGYGANLESPTTFGISDLRRQSDGFFLKLAYLFRR